MAEIPVEFIFDDDAPLGAYDHKPKDGEYIYTAPAKGIYNICGQDIELSSGYIVKVFKGKPEINPE